MERAKAVPRMSDVDWVARVTTRAPYDVPADAHPDHPGEAPFRVAVMDFGVKRSGGVGQKHLQIRAYYVKLAQWAKAHGTAWAVAETGQSISSAADQPKWLVNAYHDMQSLGGAALSYFDSNDNSVTDWRLNDSVKFNAFKSILSETAKIC